MSIQFRTKSQTPVDYSQFIANNTVTGCCYVYESGEVTFTSNKTLSECNTANGYFVVGECDANNSIKPSSIGCCCSCEGKQAGNPIVETTLCECESLSGKWTLGDCSGMTEDQLCISGTPERSNVIDFREKKACCHPELAEDLVTVFSNCTDVCSEKECAEKTIFPYTSTYYNNGRKCDIPVGSANAVSDECVLSDSNTYILNSCDNGTNVFCWLPSDSYSNESRCSLKAIYDENYSGKFIEKINQNLFQIRNEGSQTYDLILFPESVVTPQSFDITKAAYATNVIVKKICPGSLSFDNSVALPHRWYEGYFAYIDGNNIPKYVRSPTFITKYQNTPQNSPVPGQQQEQVLDLIATRTFSALITTTNQIKIFGRFYNGKTNQFRNINVFSTKLKKLYQHNVMPSGFDTNTIFPEFSTMGFVGQKLNKTYDYFSPFLDDEPILQNIRQIIRSLPAKDYVKVSFGAHTFCGIDENNVLECVSLNSELLNSYPINKKYKEISCTNFNGFQSSNNFTTPDYDYCFAVDVDNRFVEISTEVNFENDPAFSITDVLDIDCNDERCLAVVEPDENICNNQLLGSCCACRGSSDTDTVDCISPIRQGACSLIGGYFTVGGLCSDDTCSNIPNCSQNIPFRSVSSENTLPTSDLTYHENGLYVGVFEPGPPINSIGSTVNGTPLTGGSFNYKPTVFGYGTTAKKWAIIVAPNDIEIELNNELDIPEIIPGSLYDGLWNTYGDNSNYFGINGSSMEELRSNSRLSGWYIPSKQELEFVNYKLNHGFFIPEIFKSMKNGIYLTSTPYFKYSSDTNFKLDEQLFDNKAFMYGQSFKKISYGDIYLVPRTTKINVRLIRRIELE